MPSPVYRTQGWQLAFLPIPPTLTCSTDTTPFEGSVSHESQEEGVYVFFKGKILDHYSLISMDFFNWGFLLLPIMAAIPYSSESVWSSARQGTRHSLCEWNHSSPLPRGLSSLLVSVCGIQGCYQQIFWKRSHSRNARSASLKAEKKTWLVGVMQFTSTVKF